MRRVYRVTQHHHIVKMPVVTAYDRKVAPQRAIGEQLMPVQFVPVHMFEICNGIDFASPIQASVLPGVLMALDDPGRCIVGVLISVNIEPAVFVRPEDKGERPERFGGAEPGKLGLAHVDARFEVPCVGLADE